MESQCSLEHATVNINTRASHTRHTSLSTGARPQRSCPAEPWLCCCCNRCIKVSVRPVRHQQLHCCTAGAGQRRRQAAGADRSSGGARGGGGGRVSSWRAGSSQHLICHQVTHQWGQGHAAVCHCRAQHTAPQGLARYFSFHPACMHPTPAAQNPLAAACTDQTNRTCNIYVATARHPAQHREPVCRVWSVANLHALHCYTRQCRHCCCCKAQDAGGIAVARVCVSCFRGLRLANQAAAVRPLLGVVRGSNRRRRQQQGIGSQKR